VYPSWPAAERALIALTRACDVCSAPGSGAKTVKLGSETLRSMVVSRPLKAGLPKVLSGPTPGKLLDGPSGQSRITGF